VADSNELQKGKLIGSWNYIFFEIQNNRIGAIIIFIIFLYVQIKMYISFILDVRRCRQYGCIWKLPYYCSKTIWFDFIPT
jgi:hypothetical protein